MPAKIEFQKIIIKREKLLSQKKENYFYGQKIRKRLIENITKVKPWWTNIEKMT